jgi:phosphoserine phosphatase RsbU/P
MKIEVWQLRWELLNIAAAVVLLSLGAVAIVLFLSRRKTRELTLIYFGLFSILYGLRLLTTLQTIQFSLGFSPMFWLYLNWVITGTIILPFGLFLHQLATERFRRFFGWLIIFQAAFAVWAILGTALRVSLKTLFLSNNLMVLGIFLTSALFLVFGPRPAGPRKPLSRGMLVFMTGFLIWVLFILQANLLGLKILRGLNVEFVGFLVFVGCLGYVTASLSFAKEESLVNLNKEMEIARQIQASTLPKEVPRIAGLEVAARYVPMSAVAGDFYDFLAVDERRVGILVADVTGHGVPAALIASMLKVAFAGQAENAKEPARVLAGLNRALCGKFEEHFVTAAYVFLDLEKGLMRYAGAGHPPLLLASRSNGEVRAIEENGLMLGLFPEAEYASLEIALQTGDRCLLYTDGLFEAMNAGQEEFGKARLAQFLNSHRGDSAARLSVALLEEIGRWSGNSDGRRQEDDITLLVLDF